MNTVTALIDASAYGRSVVDHAAWAAGRLGAPIEVLHVVASPEGAAAGARPSLIRDFVDFDPGEDEGPRRRGEALLEEAETRLELKGLDEPALRLDAGDLVASLNDVERSALMIVVGKRGETAPSTGASVGGALGSNLERVVRAATRPVLVASRAFRPIRRATLAWDGGPSARKALDYLVKGPLLETARITVLTASENGMEAARKTLEEPVEALRAAGYDVEPMVVAGDAKASIRRHAAEAADLLVMGAYGHSRFRNLFLGSVTSETLRSCRTPVLLFR